MNRWPWLLAIVSMLVAPPGASAQGTGGKIFRHPGGYFTIEAAEDWTAEPGDAVFRFRKGDFLLDLAVREATKAAPPPAPASKSADALHRDSKGDFSVRVPGEWTVQPWPEGAFIGRDRVRMSLTAHAKQVEPDVMARVQVKPARDDWEGVSQGRISSGTIAVKIEPGFPAETAKPAPPMVLAAATAPTSSTARPAVSPSETEGTGSSEATGRRRRDAPCPGSPGGCSLVGSGGSRSSDLDALVQSASRIHVQRPRSFRRRSVLQDAPLGREPASPSA